jgi:hypothetical protein
MSDGGETRGAPRPPGGRERGERGAGLRGILVGLAILALAGLVAYLLAERNARRWFLVQDDGALYVKRGVLFPVGSLPFKTDDPELARAYAPLTPPPGTRLGEERAFDDRAALDQALYEMLARWARDDLTTGKPELVERALSWLGRAERLQGLSAAQQDDLKKLRAESGFFEARRFLETAVDALRQARERLRLSAESSSSHAGEAGAALKRVDPAIDEIFQAGRLLAPSRPAEEPAPVPAGPKAEGGAAAPGPRREGEPAPPTSAPEGEPAPVGGT